MKLLGGVLAVVIVAAVVGASRALPPGPSTIHVTTKLSSSRTGEGVVIRSYQVFNRPTYHDAIGRALLLCFNVEAHRICSEYVVLQRGQLIASGAVGGLEFYRLAVLGGTGFYDNASGSIVVSQIGPGTQQLVATLNGS